MIQIKISNNIFNNFEYTFENKCLAVVGSNGCGKTTLLKSILGIKPFTGSITLNNSSINIKDCSFLFSGDLLGFDDLNVENNIKYYFHLNNTILPEDNYSYLIELFDIAKYKNSLFKELSEGTKQKVRLIITLLNKKSLLILDEPTNFLDEKSIQALIDYITILKNTCKCICIISSNDISFLKLISDDYLYL